MSRTKKGSKGPGFEFWTARPGNRHGGGVGKYAKRITHKIERQQNKPTKGDVVIAMQDLAEARDVCGAPCCEYCGTTHNVQGQRGRQASAAPDCCTSAVATENKK